jgi:hypothetical protein
VSALASHRPTVATSATPTVHAAMISTAIMPAGPPLGGGGEQRRASNRRANYSDVQREQRVDHATTVDRLAALEEPIAPCSE